MNGDGLLIYPGRDFIFPAEDRGIDGPLPSIRLKNWRRGIQDVEYLALARQAGEGTLADQVLDTLVPSALDENGLSGGESVPWEEDGEIWLQQRRRLADLFPPGVEPDADGGEAPGDDGGAVGDDGGSPGDPGDSGAEDGGSGQVEGSNCSCRTSEFGGILVWSLVLLLFFRRRCW